MAFAGTFFVFLGSAVGFGSLITALINCYFVNPIGLWSIKLVMGPFLVMYIINGTLLAFYLSSMFTSLLPNEAPLDSYVHYIVTVKL